MITSLLKSATLVAALLAGAAGAAGAREFRVSSFEPAGGFYSAKILQAWIDKVNPRLAEGSAFKLYPGSILGSPPAQADLVRAGVADMALIVPTYTPGLLPMSGVVEVPGLVDSSTTGTAILNALAEDGTLDAEYADYKVIALFTTPAYRLLVKDRAVPAPDAMEGLKMRSPSPFGSTILAAVGASGVSIPAPQVYENLERGVVAGAVWVMDSYRTFRLDEVAPHVTSLRLTAQPMAILMNRASYDSLSDADRKVIDEMSGRANAEWIASVVDQTDAEIEAEFRAEGKVEFVDPDPAQMALWQDALAGLPEAWVAGQSDTDLARRTLTTAQAVAAR